MEIVPSVFVYFWPYAGERLAGPLVNFPPAAHCGGGAWLHGGGGRIIHPENVGHGVITKPL